MLRSIALVLLCGNIVTVETDDTESSPAHYQINARVAPDTGVLTAVVTLTLPPADIPPGTCVSAR